MSTPGTYREDDQSPVPFANAVTQWADEALTALIDTARTYNGTITYGELGDEVQGRTGIRTRVLLMNWIGRVLERVAAECYRRQELPLTALCVHQDGTVGEGYADAMERYGGGRPDDPEVHAAESRLECYRKYARDLPANGGRAELTPQEASRRRAATPARPLQVCSVHHTVLPRTGVCDECN